MNNHRPAARINAIATATPSGEIDALYREWAARQLAGKRDGKLFARMSARSGIDCRYTVLDGDRAWFGEKGFYRDEAFPSTGERMAVYAATAPDLALKAIAGLPSVDGITHIVLASCTGFIAPGLDQIVARRLGLGSGVERVSIGFMGCYAGITALRTAAHIVRSDSDARVLVLCVELCSLHLQETDDLESLLGMGQFADGAAAAIVSASGEGLALGKSISAELEESSDLISWHIGDSGFVMHLSGAVPGRIADALDAGALTSALGEGFDPATINGWAVHPGGRSILDAVERSLALAPDCLTNSREVLRECGNMSSATVIFVLGRMMAARPSNGLALAFGPGLAMEGLRFAWTGDAG